MRILVAGASGVLGRRVVPRLVEAGHHVTGTTRHDDRVESLERVGARAAVVDAYDAPALARAVEAARPDLVMHLLTDLSEGSSDANARMRIDGTRNLIAAAHAAGVRRIVAQSIAWAYAPGATPAGETTPLDLDAGEPRSRTIDGVRALEQKVAELPEAVVLRFGVFYGADTWYSAEGFVGAKLLRGEAATSQGVTSFVHLDDAAAAAADAVDWPAGTFNVADDEPAAGAEWSALFAQTIGAPAPGPLPEAAPFERGADNDRARRERGWTPRYASWREGFRASLRPPTRAS